MMLLLHRRQHRQILPSNPCLSPSSPTRCFGKMGGRGDSSRQMSIFKIKWATISLILLHILVSTSFGSCKAAIKVRRHFDEWSASSNAFDETARANLDTQFGGGHSPKNQQNGLPSTSQPSVVSRAKMLLEAHRNSSKLMKGQQQQQQKKPKIDAHCWIKVERKSGEFYEENGSCSRLSPAFMPAKVGHSLTRSIHTVCSWSEQ